jgi:hypothetical protein
MLDAMRERASAILLACLVAGKPQSRSDPVGVPSFDRVLVLDAAADPAANVSVGDLNGDGALDLVLVKGRHWPGKSRVFLGDGRGHVQAAYDLGEAAYRSYSGRLADLDGDGDLDIVLSNDTPDPKLTFLNDGKGRFTPASSYGHAEWETRNASVADLNGDGLPDIVIANRSDNAPVNYVCLNRGKGRFDGSCAAFAQGSATSITPADFNRDGLVDLAVPARDGGQSYVYLNGGNAAFANDRRTPFGPPDATIRMAEAADLDGDGLLDLVAIDEKRGPAVYFGQKGGTFSSGLALDNGKVTPYALALSDLNHDGKVDIVVGNVEAPSSLFFNDGSGRHYVPSRFGDSKGTAYGFAIADLDGDGQMDVAVARSDAPSVVFFGKLQ